MQLNVHLDLQAHGVKPLRSIWSPRSFLFFRTSSSARRTGRAFVCSVRVATGRPCCCGTLGAVFILRRQVLSMFSRLVLLRAPLALRLLFHSSRGELPVNKSLKSDKVKPSCLLQKAQKPRRLHFAL